MALLSRPTIFSLRFWARATKRPRPPDFALPASILDPEDSSDGRLCEINDHPCAPIGRGCRERASAADGEQHGRIACCCRRAQRYVEKLATGRDHLRLIVDVDPSRGRRVGRYLLRTELTIDPLKTTAFAAAPRPPCASSPSRLLNLRQAKSGLCSTIMQGATFRRIGLPAAMTLELASRSSPPIQATTARGKIHHAL